MGNYPTYWPGDSLGSVLQAALEFHQAVWWDDGEVRKPSIKQGTARWHARTRTLVLALLSWGHPLAPTVAPCSMIDGVRVGQRVDSHPLIWVSGGHVCWRWWTPDWAVFTHTTLEEKHVLMAQCLDVEECWPHLQVIVMLWKNPFDSNFIFSTTSLCIVRFDIFFKNNHLEKIISLSKAQLPIPGLLSTKN